MAALVGDATKRPQVTPFRIRGRQQSVRDLRGHLHHGNVEFITTPARGDVLQAVLDALDEPDARNGVSSTA